MIRRYPSFRIASTAPLCRLIATRISMTKEPTLKPIPPITSFQVEASKHFFSFQILLPLHTATSLYSKLTIQNISSAFTLASAFSSGTVYAYKCGNIVILSIRIAGDPSGLNEGAYLIDSIPSAYQPVNAESVYMARRGNTLCTVKCYSNKFQVWTMQSGATGTFDVTMTYMIAG